MGKRLRRAVAGLATCAAALAGAACGGRDPAPLPLAPGPTPSAPFFPAGTVVALVSGDDGVPVAGAEVRVSGRAYRSDATGQVALAEGVERGATLEVETAEFLPRRTRLRGPEDTRVALWPRELRRIGLTEEYTRTLAYTWWNGGATKPLHRLRRGTSRVSVLPGPEVRAQPDVMSALLLAAESMTAATGIDFSVGEPGGDVAFDVVVDPTGGCRAATTIGCVYIKYSDDWEIHGARIVFLNADHLALRRAGLFLHEMGHGLGFGHSLRASDLMGPGWWSLADFTDAEWLTVRMMLRRPGGNRFPDDDTSVAGTGVPSTERVACGL